VFKAHRWLYHSTLGPRVTKKKRRRPALDGGEDAPALQPEVRAAYSVGPSIRPICTRILDRSIYSTNLYHNIHFRDETSF